MMLGFDRPASSANGTPDAAGMPQNPFAMMGGAGGEGPDADDPMMKMLQQMMGAGGAGGMPNPFGGADGGGQNNPFAAMMGGGGGGQQQQQQAQQTDAYAAIWRLLHFVLALGLGLYIALLTSFSGTKIARERGAVASATGGGSVVVEDDAADLRRYFFWTFATAETVLLTSRFFLDRNRASSPPGILWTVMGFLPDSQWKGYLAMVLRYSQIFSTVRSDMLVCIFVLGVCAWARS